MKRVTTMILLGCLTLTCAFAQINTDRVLSIGRNALYFEDYVLSIQYFNEVIKVKPYLPEPYLYRSIAKIYLDDYLGASQDATACLERNPFITTAYQVRGIARQNMREYDAAITDFQMGLKDQPENRTFLRALAVTYALKKEYGKADSCFQHFMDICPNEPTAYLNCAQMKMELGDSLQALQLLDRAIVLDKSSAYAFALRAMLHEQQDHHEQAIADMDMAIKLDPEQSSFYINRALIRYNMDNLNGAVTDYGQALELSPNSIVGHYNRGLLLAQVGARNKAIEDFTAVIAQEPDNTFAIYNRAILRDEVGDLNGAIEDYTLVYEQHPNYFPVLYARSEAYRKQGKSKKSDDDYKLAFAVQNKVKEEHETRVKAAQAAGKELSDESELEQDAELTDDEKTRKESERNIRKFNRLMASSVGSEGQKYSSELRGRVQDKQGSVEMMPLFVLSYYEKMDDARQVIYFEKNLSDFNRAGLLTRRLKCVYREPMLTQAQAHAHFTSIDDYSRLIGLNGGNVISYFGRSLDYMLVQDYQSAIADLSEVVFRKDNFILAYFNRAVLRFRQLEMDEKSGMVNNRSTDSDEDLKNTALKAIGSQQAAVVKGSGISMRINNGTMSAAERARFESEHLQQIRRVECEMAMRDLDKVIEMDPQFVYAYYNRAFISAKLNNMDAAINDLDLAIQYYPNFAEAYYNRGLIRLRQGKTRMGIADLSKAGELGLAQAYSVLKRAQE